MVAVAAVTAVVVTSGADSAAVGDTSGAASVAAAGAGSVVRPRQCMAADSAAVEDSVGHRPWAGDSVGRRPWDSAGRRPWAGDSAVEPGASVASDQVTAVSPDHRR